MRRSDQVRRRLSRPPLLLLEVPPPFFSLSPQGSQPYQPATTTSLRCTSQHFQSLSSVHIPHPSSIFVAVPLFLLPNAFSRTPSGHVLSRQERSQIYGFICRWSNKSTQTSSAYTSSPHLVLLLQFQLHLGLLQSRIVAASLQALLENCRPPMSRPF